MDAPVFEEVAPASDCDCPGCADRRRARARGLPVRLGGSPAAHGARRQVVVLAAAAGTVLSGSQLTAVAAEYRPLDSGHPAGDSALLGGVGSLLPGPTPAPADGPGEPGIPYAPGGGDADGSTGTPQGTAGPLYGPAAPPGSTATPAATPAATNFPAVTRAEIINRAKTWVNAKVPYSMSKYWSDGYRQDCSGFVSMAWGLGSNQWTGSLAGFAVRITKAELQPGDMLLFHNPSNPGAGSHVTIFGGWTDYTRNHYIAYEQTPPKAIKRSTPYPYWNNANNYIPYRYRGVQSGGGSSGPTGSIPPGSTAFPGADKFGPGANNRHVTELGRMLRDRGGSRFYRGGPGPRWSDADLRATRAFQQAQGWKGSAADGIPGPKTWDYLVRGKGRDIPGTGTGTGTTGGTGGSRPGSSVQNPGQDRSPAFPGRGHFRPGQNNPHVTQLGKQLKRKGFGRHYAQGPGPRWSESDRRNVESFQRAQGWRGAEADGYPGPETWRRLFS
ncbi:MULTISPECIES: peptidoglycan-binding protein [unclassified Streptomyces]|uniref:peptidoglycan-binding protein n=1 Tax=Streptomyces sp. NPDC005955 TaxID=3364738 RepID=UPI003681BB98